MDPTQLLSIWYYWAPFLVALISLMICVFRRGQESLLGQYLGVLASAGFGYIGWKLTQGSIFIGIVVFFYGSMVFGIRCNLWMSEKYKFTRLFYWAMVDVLPAVALFVGYDKWPGKWPFYVGWFLAVMVYTSLLKVALMKVFPIVGRQEYLILLASDNKERLAMEREINRIERERLRKKSLRMVKKHKAQVAKAAQEVSNGKFSEAKKRLEPILKILEEIPALISDQRTLLGQIYLLKAKIKIQSREFARADALVRKARAYAQPDLSIVSALAEYAARNHQRQADMIGYCVEYLQMRRGQPIDKTTQLVSDFLQTCCAVDDSTSVSAAGEAQALAQKVTNAAPELAWPYRIIGAANVIKGQSCDAIKPLERALELDSSQWQAHYYLGVAHHYLKNAQESYRYLLKSLTINPGQSTRAAILLGGLLLESYHSAHSLTGDHQNDLDQAIHWLKHGIEKNDKNPTAHFDLAKAYQWKGDLQKARTSLEIALKLDSGFKAAHLLLADIHYRVREWREAIPHYQQALTGQPSDLEINIKTGHCLLETQHYKEAVELLLPYKNENPRAALLLGRSYLRLRRFREAAEELSPLVTENGHSQAACYYLGCSLAWMGRQGDASSLRQAAKWFEQVAESNDPDYAAKAGLQLGHLYLMRERTEDAIRFYQKAFANGDLKLDAGLGLVRAYLIQDRDDEALKTLSQLTASNGSESRVHYLRGMIYERQGRMAEAEESYTRANAAGALAIIHFLKGDIKKANELCKQARSQGCENDRLLYFSGLAAAAERDYETAVSEWKILLTRYPEDVHLKLNIARAYYLIGCGHYQQKDYSKTTLAWEEFYKIYHVDDQIRENLGNAYLMQAYQVIGKAESEAAVRRARELNMDPRLCDFIESLHKLEIADAGGIEILKRLVQQMPEDAQVLYNLGLAEMRANKHQEAIAHLSQARRYAAGELRETVGWALATAYAGLSDWKNAANAVADMIALN